ncbi:MAG: hypothetical protein ACRD0Y_01485 [Terriglobales bacterium]
MLEAATDTQVRGIRVGEIRLETVARIVVAALTTPGHSIGP